MNSQRPAALVWRQIELPDADVRLAQLCAGADACRRFEVLRTQVPWEQHHVRIFGRAIDAPRRSCWIGDAGCAYRYSQLRYEPRPWTRALLELRESLFTHCGERFNSVLCNLYRDGRDSMGWHSDDEPELGPTPVIASLSFGATRRFRLRHRHDARGRAELDLESGSLLVMSGATQRHYRHDLPKTARTVGPRINLTFRRILIEPTHGHDDGLRS